MPRKASTILNMRECPGTYEETILVSGKEMKITRQCGALISYDTKRCRNCGTLFAQGSLSGWMPGHARTHINRNWCKQFLKG